MFVGIGPCAKKWTVAVRNAASEMKLSFRTLAIGYGGNYVDLYLDWEQVMEISEDGCVLVRLDRFVAWRSKDACDGCDEKLAVVLQKILLREA